MDKETQDKFEELVKGLGNLGEAPSNDELPGWAKFNRFAVQSPSGVWIVLWLDEKDNTAYLGMSLPGEDPMGPEMRYCAQFVSWVQATAFLTHFFFLVRRSVDPPQEYMDWLQAVNEEGLRRAIAARDTGE